MGKPSTTHYQVISRDEQTRLRTSMTPVTGRSHQLRVHMAALGHPIIGDSLALQRPRARRAPAVARAPPNLSALRTGAKQSGSLEVVPFTRIQVDLRSLGASFARVGSFMRTGAYPSHTVC